MVDLAAEDREMLHTAEAVELAETVDMAQALDMADAPMTMADVS